MFTIATTNLKSAASHLLATPSPHSQALLGISFSTRSPTAQLSSQILNPANPPSTSAIRQSHRSPVHHNKQFPPHPASRTTPSSHHQPQTTPPASLNNTHTHMHTSFLLLPRHTSIHYAHPPAKLKRPRETPSSNLISTTPASPPVHPPGSQIGCIPLATTPSYCETQRRGSRYRRWGTVQQGGRRARYARGRGGEGRGGRAFSCTAVCLSGAGTGHDYGSMQQRRPRACIIISTQYIDACT